MERMIYQKHGIHNLAYRDRRAPAIHVDEKGGLRLLSGSRFCKEIRRNPQRGAVCSYLVFFKLGVKRGRMNSCAMAAIIRSPSLIPNVTIRSPVPRFVLG